MSRFARTPKSKVSDSFRRRLGYDVLFDAGTPDELATLFPYAAPASLADVGLRVNTKDETIVAVAHTNFKLIVTHDKRMDDYVRRHQRHKPLHRCLNGLDYRPVSISRSVVCNRYDIGNIDCCTEGLSSFGLISGSSISLLTCAMQAGRFFRRCANAAWTRSKRSLGGRNYLTEPLWPSSDQPHS